MGYIDPKCTYFSVMRVAIYHNKLYGNKTILDLIIPPPWRSILEKCKEEQYRTVVQFLFSEGESHQEN